MISRRTVIALLPTGLVVGSNFFNLASALAQEPAIRPDPDAAKRILAGLDQWSKSPHYDATKPLIQFYSRVANLRLAATNSRSKLNSKADLTDALGLLNAIYPPVNTILSVRKTIDDTIQNDNKRRISPQEKTKLGTEIDIKNSKLNDIWADMLSGSGDFDLSKVRATKAGSASIDKVIAMADDLLKASINLSHWGPDAFYSVARGYATFEFMRYCVRSSRSSPLLARAFTLKVISDSESYFSLRTSSLTATAPTTSSSSTAPTTTTPSGPVSASARYDVEKDMIDKFFQRSKNEFYLGSELPNNQNGCTRGQVVNHYGKFTTGSNFTSGFTLETNDGWSSSGCASQINDREVQAINGTLSPILDKFAPSDKTEVNARRELDDLKTKLNQHVQRVKDNRAKELAQSGQSPAPPPPTPSGNADMDPQQEFNVMQQMTSALREVLAVT